NLEIVSREMLKVQEEERVKISRELHDEIGQLLATMTVKLALIKKAFNGTTEGPLQVKLGETEVLAGEMFGRIRRFLKELRPVGLTQNGLVSAVKRLIREYSENTEIDTKFLGEVEALNLLMDETKTVVFRVIQESLTNITKHADATLVTLEVKKRRNSVQIKIVDNGIGFDVTKMNSTAVAHRGMGLIGMAERVKLVGGEFQLTSKVDIGTTIEVTIPLPGSLAGT
ncbi:MAG TPA: sensor histidine kinase, partial [Syntrophales bacterium]|nr:sensor histidine kinase [Syntrophales bacterium]